MLLWWPESEQLVMVTEPLLRLVQLVPAVAVAVNIAIKEMDTIKTLMV